jgi:hypothetical protein
LNEEKDDRISKDEAVEAIKQAMEPYIQRQEQHNAMMLRLMTQAVQQIGFQPQFGAPQMPAPPPPPKKVTLSGLLNVIDGATAAEGRLLIMTTNHPTHLDLALRRKGRVDRDFHIGYATKITAELTFNRIFGQDKCKEHTIEAINRFAKAFRVQFPIHSKIPTATVAAYCAHYRGRPCEAVRMFAEYFSIGDAIFDIKINEQEDVPSNSINIPESYDKELLRVSAEDMCSPDAILKDAAVPKTGSALSLWRPWAWLGTRMVKPNIDNSQLLPTRLFIKEAGEPVNSLGSPTKDVHPRAGIDISQLPLNPRQAQIAAHLTSIGLRNKPPRAKIFTRMQKPNLRATSTSMTKTSATSPSSLSPTAFHLCCRRSHRLVAHLKSHNGPKSTAREPRMRNHSPL